MGIIKDIFDKNALKAKVASLQHLVEDILTGITINPSAKYKGNNYQTYEKMVEQLSKMYNGCGDWGCDLAKVIIELRAAFTLAGGISVRLKKDSEGKNELDFINRFIDINNLDEEVVFDWGKEAEVEGKFLCRLFPNPETLNIDARFIPWIAHRYIIETKQDDYAKYIGAQYYVNNDKSLTNVNITETDFVYKKFGGRTHLVNDTPSKAATVINRIENLDKALWDWRKINYLFASPTPTIETKDSQQAKDMYKVINERNWKIGKLLITSGVFKFAEVGLASKESLREEIVTYIKIISGVTSIPPHFLGAPDLMSNRAVSNDLFDLIEAGVVKERKIWAGGYKEMFDKALMMSNTVFNTAFKPDLLEVDIPQVSEHKLKEIIDTWLPLEQAGIIDEDTVRSMVPGIDPEQVKKNKMQDTINMIKEMRAQGLNNPANNNAGSAGSAGAGGGQ